MVSTSKSKSEFVQRAERSFQRAVRKVYEERARQNETVSIWRDGKVMILPAAELLKELCEINGQGSGCNESTHQS